MGVEERNEYENALKQGQDTSKLLVVQDYAESENILSEHQERGLTPEQKERLQTAKKRLRNNLKLIKKLSKDHPSIDGSFDFFATPETIDEIFSRVGGLSGSLAYLLVNYGRLLTDRGLAGMLLSMSEIGGVGGVIAMILSTPNERGFSLKDVAIEGADLNGHEEFGNGVVTELGVLSYKRAILAGLGVSGRFTILQYGKTDAGYGFIKTIKLYIKNNGVIKSKEKLVVYKPILKDDGEMVYTKAPKKIAKIVLEESSKRKQKEVDPEEAVQKVEYLAEISSQVVNELQSTESGSRIDAIDLDLLEHDIE